MHFKILVEFRKEFQRKEENETKDSLLMESQKLGFGVFLAQKFLFFSEKNRKPEKKNVKVLFIKYNVSINLNCFSHPIFSWTEFTC